MKHFKERKLRMWLKAVQVRKKLVLRQEMQTDSHPCRDSQFAWRKKIAQWLGLRAICQPWFSMVLQISFSPLGSISMFHVSEILPSLQVPLTGSFQLENIQLSKNSPFY